MEASLQVELGRLTQALRKLEGLGRDLRPVFRALRRPLLRDQREHRQKQEGPDGKWPKRSPFYQARVKNRTRAAGRKRSPKVLGRLPTALKIELTRQRLSIFSRVKWADVHQSGAGRVGRAPKIPARPFLWISGTMIKEMTAIVAKMAKEKWP